MPIRGGLPICCASAASMATRKVSATVAGVIPSASIHALIKLGWPICLTATFTGRGERTRVRGPVERLVRRLTARVAKMLLIGRSIIRQRRPATRRGPRPAAPGRCIDVDEHWVLQRPASYGIGPQQARLRGHEPMVSALRDMIPGAYKRLELREGGVHLPGHGRLLRLFLHNLAGQLLEIAQHWARDLQHLDLVLKLRPEPFQRDRVFRVEGAETIDLQSGGGMVEHPPEIARKCLVR